MTNVRDIRNAFIFRLQNHMLTEDGMLEIIGASFLADEPSIFGEPNDDYIRREIEWYETRMPNINVLEPPIPQIWIDVAGPDGDINSQYGHLIHNEDQFDHVVSELLRDKHSRRGTIIYTRPTMHVDATADGKNDFVCTNAVGYFIRGDRLYTVVQMRSNDVVFGYRNDYAWQKHVTDQIADMVSVPVGQMIWQAASLHVYPRHFDLVRNHA